MAAKKLTRSEIKRQDILTAAKKAFQENGVQGTSMDDLAARARVSKRTVYNHFSSKEELVIHLVTELWKQATQDVNLKYEPDHPLLTQLCDLLKAEIDLVCSSEYLDLARVAFGYYFYHPDILQAELGKFDKKETALFHWLIAARNDNRLKSVDIEFAMSQLHSMIKGNCFWPQLLQIGEIPDQAARKHLAYESAAMFLAYYQSPQCSQDIDTGTHDEIR